MDTIQFLGVDTRYPSPAPSSRSLPEDDGMRGLRLKMHEIRNLAASTQEKARAMHLLMTRDYLALNDDELLLDPTNSHESESLENSYNICPQDLVPTYCPDVFDDDASPALGCEHYSRNVKVQCYDCNQWHTCRHCHDASRALPFPHQLNRKLTRNMLCLLCKTPQPAAPVCIKCDADTAYYFCPKCKLWDNDSTKRIYHCDDCGICRRGEGLGKDYVHCKRCNVCISISTSSTHPCVERATDCNCPLCLEYLFSSSTPVVSLKCGHYMHALCYKDLMHVTYRCPVCNKSAVNMELQWRKLDDEIRLQPMPEEEFDDYVPDVSEPNRRRIPRRVFVGCNDCGGRGWANFHWLGLICSHCDGYNTSQTTQIGTESTASRPIIQRHDFAGVNMLPVMSEEERADSVYGCPASPSQLPIPQQPQALAMPQNSPTGRSYFLQAEQEESLRNTERALSAGDAFRNLPYDIIQRFSRSLSPMRLYLENLDIRGVEGDGASGVAEGERASEHKEAERRPQTAESRDSFWGPNGVGIILGDDDDDDDEDEEDDEEGEDDEDDESDDGTAGSDDIDAEDDDEHGAEPAEEEFMALPGHF